MADVFQKDRSYYIQVGDSAKGVGLEITNSSQISFDVSKSSSNRNRTNSATIEIYNLSDESLKVIDVDYPYIMLKAGYLDIGVEEIISGQVTNVSTRKNGTDRITQLIVGSAYTELNHTLLSKTFPPGSTTRQVYQECANKLGINKTVFNSVNIDSPLLNGYPMSGSCRAVLDELSNKNQHQWQVDGDVLYVHDADRGSSEKFELAYVVSKYTGLIENAYRVSGEITRSNKDKVKKHGVQFKMLLNPYIVAGSIIKLEDTLINGWYKVDSLRHSGSWRETEWYTEVQCSSIEKVTNNSAR